MSGTVCCYSGCKKNYSTDKDSVVFFKFPDDPNRRKTWMQNSGNPELQTLPERQLRGKRICSDHFHSKSFVRPTTLSDTAVPLKAKATTMPPVKASPSPVPAPTPSADERKKRTQSSGNQEVQSLPKRQLRGKRSSDHLDSKSSAVPQKAKAKVPTTPAVKASAPPTTAPTSPGTKGSPSPASAPTSPVKASAPAAAVPTSPGTKGLPLPSPASAPTSPVKAPAPPAAVPTSPTTKGSPSPASALTSPVKASEPPAAVPTPPITKGSPSPAPTPTSPAKESPSSTPAPTSTSSSADRKKRKQNNGNPEVQTLPKRQLRGKRICLDKLDSNSKSETLNDAAVPLKAKAKKVTTTPAVKASASPAAGPKTPATASPAPASASPALDPTSSSDVRKKRKQNSGNSEVKTVPEKQLRGKRISSDHLESKSILKPTTVSDTAVPLKAKVKMTTAPVVEAVVSPVPSPASSYDEYEYFDRDFGESFYEDEGDARMDREFERFHASLKKFLRLSGQWTMGGVQWDPQGKRKVLIISEPEIPPHGRPCVKRCLQFFEDKAIRVFIDGMDMTDVFGMSCYAEKEDVAALVCRVAEASSCCGVPEMVLDDVVSFPNVKKRNASYFDSECPGVIPNDAYDPICMSCKQLQERVLENREREKQRLLERRIRSLQKEFQHPFGQALYNMFNDLVDETDPSKPKKKRTKETFFRKFLHDTRYKYNGDTARTERVYIEKPISVDSVSASFQDIVSKLGFNSANSKKKGMDGSLHRPSPLSAPRPSRLTPSSSIVKVERKMPMHVEHILPFSAGTSFTLDDGQEYELIGEVDAAATEIVEMKPTPAPQYEIIEVDDETLAKLASSKNQVVMLPESAAVPMSHSNLQQVTRIDANDPNLSQILKAINTSHGFKV